jgi:hypothetical protein
VVAQAKLSKQAVGIKSCDGPHTEHRSLTTNLTPPLPLHYQPRFVDLAALGIATIPRTIAIYDVDWPCDFGIVVVPGCGQVVAVVFT